MTDKPCRAHFTQLSRLLSTTLHPVTRLSRQHQQAREQILPKQFMMLAILPTVSCEDELDM